MAITADQQKMIDELRSVGWTGEVPAVTGRKLTAFLNLVDDGLLGGIVKASRPQRKPGRPKSDKPVMTSAERAARSKERQRARIDLCLAAPGECTDRALLAETLVHALRNQDARAGKVHARLGQLIDANNAATQN